MLKKHEPAIFKLLNDSKKGDVIKYPHCSMHYTYNIVKLYNDEHERQFKLKSVKGVAEIRELPLIITNDDILSKFNNLTKTQAISVLYDALDFMSEYNGRTKLFYIGLAMGYKNTEGLSDTWTLSND